MHITRVVARSAHRNPQPLTIFACQRAASMTGEGPRRCQPTARRARPFYASAALTGGSRCARAAPAAEAASC